MTNQAVQAVATNTANRIVTRDGSGNFEAGTVTATLSGNATTATTATTLATGRTIALTGDVTGTTGSFDGSANISAATTIANSAVTLNKLVAAVQEALVPAGAIQAFAMNSAPSGWLPANGDPVNRVGAYAALFTAIGTTYGAGDGSTTFNLPDLRGYFLRGSGTNSDGTAAGTFATKIADALKTHTHSVSGNTGNQSANHTHSVSGTTGNDSPDHTHSGTTGNDSPDHSHSYTRYSTLQANLRLDGGAANSGFWRNTASQNTGGASARHQHSFTSGGASARHQHSFSATTAVVSADHTHAVSLTSGNPSTGTSDETRPKNISMLYCIKF